VLARYMGPRVVAWLEGWLEQDLRLTVNRTKTRVVHVKTPRQDLDFLGCSSGARRESSTRRSPVTNRWIRMDSEVPK